jgi:hypothetical protein
MSRGARADSPLDRIPMAEWLLERGLTAPELRWYVDYACRDDFGALSRDVSAWAGVHYFASRPKHETGPLTWPEGNGWIARRLAAKVKDRIVTGAPVIRVARSGNRWTVDTPDRRYVSESVIWAAPSFVAPYVIEELAPMRQSAREVVYSPWLTANLTLDRWPRERGGRNSAPPSWDNVIYDSPSLGYVVATHQSLASRADRTVWTYYWALAEHTPSAGRELLQRRGWREWTELILADLERVHPDVRDCVSRIDIMRMGHAMVRPVIGALRNGERARRMERPGLYFANSDVSAFSLFEEAQYHGVSAARRALRQ